MNATAWATQRLDLHLIVDDPEVVGFLGELAEEDRDDHALVALRIGALALQRARGAVDVEAIRREGERLVADVRVALSSHAAEVSSSVGQSLGTYLDPTTGVLQQRLQRLVSNDGELAAVLQQHVGGDNSAIARTLAGHLGATSPVFRMLDPKQKDGIVVSLESVIAEALAGQRREIVKEFSLDDQNSALSRLIRELSDQQGKLRTGWAEDVGKLQEQLSLDHEDSALSRLVNQVEAAQKGIVEQFSLDSDASALSRIKRELAASITDLGARQATFQTQVLELMTRMEERKRVAATGTQHGHDFEAALVGRLRALSEGAGDLFAHVAAATGKIRSCKKGDVVVTIGPQRAGAGRRVVFEAKEDASYTDASALVEIEEARRNRDAGVGVFVFSRSSAPDTKAFRRLGDDLLVVWDSEDPVTDVVLEAAYAVATALLAGEDARADSLAVDLDAMDTSILDIEKQASRMQGIRDKCESIRRAADHIDEEARKTGENLAREARRLMDHAGALRKVL